MRKAIAWIDAVGGRAVITEAGGEIYILETDKPGVLQDGKSIHLGMFLQPAMTALEQRPAGDFPYDDIARYLDLAHRRRQALSMFLTTLDGQMTTDLRNEFAREAEALLADDDVNAWVEEIFLKAPLPDEADIENGPKEGRAGAILTEGVKKWRG